MTFHSTNAQWASGGPFGGDVKGITSIGNNLYVAGAVHAGVFRSIDNGLTWKICGLDDITITCLYSNGNTIYAGSIGILYYSNDYGNTWVPSGNFSFNYVTSITKVDSVIIIGVNNMGAYRSTNNGSSWSNVSNGINGLQVTSLTSINTTFFLGTNNGLFKSTNNGDNWLPNNSGLKNNYIFSLCTRNNSLFTGTPSGIYKSNDFGATHTRVGFSDTSVVSISVKGNSVLATSFQGVYLSTNNGTSWKSVGLSTISVGIVYFYGNYFIAGTSLGVYLSSNNGNTWMSSNSGLNNMPIEDLCVQGNYVFAATFGHGIYRSSNLGDTWETSSGDGMLANQNVWHLYVLGNYLFAGTNEAVYKSSNFGNTWEYSGLQQLCNGVKCLYSNNQYLFAGTIDGGIFRTSNLGNTWEHITLPIQIGVVESINSIGTNLFAATNTNGVFKSTNNGDSWVSANNGLGSANIQLLYVSNNTMYASADKLYKTTNNGQSWSAINFELGYFINSIRKQNSSLIIGTERGVYRSTDEGKQWDDISTGLPNNGITSIVFKDSVFLAATYGLSVFKSASQQIGLTVIGDYKFEVCNGDTIYLPIRVYGNFGPNNTFTIQVSDSPWSFTNLRSIASVTTNKSTDLPIYQSKSSLPFWGKIQINSTDPPGYYQSLNSAIRFIELPNPKIDGPSEVCEKSIATFQVAPDKFSTYRWNLLYGNASFLTPTNNNTVTMFLQNAGNISLKCTQTNTLGCSQDSLKVFLVTPTPKPIILGPSKVCLNNNFTTYSVAQLNDCSYEWLGLKKGKLISTNNQSSITCLWDSEGIDTIKLKQYYSKTGCAKDTFLVVHIAKKLSQPNIFGNLNVQSKDYNIEFRTDSIMGFSYKWNIDSGDAYIIGAMNKPSVRLAFGTKGYVKLRLSQFNSQGCTSESVVTINIYETTINVPEQPLLVKPPSNSIQKIDSVVFCWRKNNSTNYNFLIAHTSSNYIIDTTLMDTTLTMLIPENGVYKWKVRGTNQLGISEWSETRYFTTDASLFVNSHDAQTSVIIKPNPSNDVLTIVGLDKEQTYEILIYSEIGELALQTNQLSIDLCCLPNGIYFCYIVNCKNKNTILRKFSVVR
ncbi:MAG: T9SS type A sorting domain-containing protein [Candidatus Kapaibacterium sp.]|nr:hypothetical protein [Bacteroidota bacterium]